MVLGKSNANFVVVKTNATNANLCISFLFQVQMYALCLIISFSRYGLSLYEKSSVRYLSVKNSRLVNEKLIMLSIYLLFLSRNKNSLLLSPANDWSNYLAKPSLQHLNHLL